MNNCPQISIENSANGSIEKRKRLLCTYSYAYTKTYNMSVLAIFNVMYIHSYINVSNDSIQNFKLTDTYRFVF